MQQHLRYSIVDVFAQSPRTGNQLAVVENAGDLSAADMQAITCEFNFSETTFVTSASPDRAQVRIFDPVEELPFAGHPTLGTAWVLTGGRGAITLELQAGAVPVEFRDALAWMTPPSAEFGADIDAASAAQALTLSPADLDLDFSCISVRCGPLFRLIAVRDKEVLARAQMRMPEDPAAAGAIFAFCRGGYSRDADFAARMFFFDGHAIREDPATGSANTAFANYLRDRGHAGSLIIEQGFEMGRPSRIYADVGDVVRIGGRVQPFANGELR